jgi:hypothetical protein
MGGAATAAQGLVVALGLGPGLAPPFLSLVGEGEGFVGSGLGSGFGEAVAVGVGVGVGVVGVGVFGAGGAWWTGGAAGGAGT